MVDEQYREARHDVDGKETTEDAVPKSAPTILEGETQREGPIDWVA